MTTDSRVDQDLKQLSRGASTNMSPAAILRRLEIVDEMRELADALAKAKKLGRLNGAEFRPHSVEQ